jgi:predicted ATPase/DNA-binding winged helix-turn-helix (wHTH) protein
MFVFSPFRLDIANASLQRGKQAIVLTPKAFNVLRYLVEHAGQLVTKDDLWRAVWPGISVTDATLTVSMNELRKALGDQPKAPRYIETVHRLGYRFIAPVSTEAVRVADSSIRGEHFKLARGLPPSTPHFVGRHAELAELHKWLERALEGERQIVFVTGEPGIGKTTLVDEFLRQEQVSGEQNLWVGRGQCIEHYGTGEAYLPLLDALGRLCRGPGGGRLLELLDEHAPAWLGQLPSLLGAAQRRELKGRVAGATHARMLRELADAIEVITAEKPLVLRLEDLHWSDYSTLEWLGFLARRQESARLLMLGTYRPVEVILREHPLKNLKQELQIHGQCKELPLTLLSEPAVKKYLNLRFASPFSSNLSGARRRGEAPAQEPLLELAHTIYQRIDGNPLFMVNMVDYLAEREVVKTLGDAVTAQSADVAGVDRIDTPPSIVEMIERNLERLNPDEQAVLEAASVAGAQFPAAALAAALNRPLSEVEACCTRLSRQQQFVHSRGTWEWPDGTVAARFDFQHALYREALYKRIPPGRRIQLHERIAVRAEAAYGQQVEEVAAELAYHYGLCGNKAKTLKYLEIAGRQAEQRSAYAESVGHFAAAIELLKSRPRMRRACAMSFFCNLLWRSHYL